MERSMNSLLSRRAVSGSEIRLPESRWEMGGENRRNLRNGG